MAILAAPTRLAHEAPFDAHRARDRLTIGHLRAANVALHAELTLEAVHDDVQVQLTHAGDDGLAGLVVILDAEGGVFFGKFDQRFSHLVLVGLRLWLDGNLDHRLGELDRLEHDRDIRVAQRFAGEGFLQTDDGGDVAGFDA